MPVSNYFQDEPTCKVIGPQIGPSFGRCGIRITIALPHRPEIDQLICHLSAANSGDMPGHTGLRISSDWCHFRFEFPDLTPGERYTYKFTLPDGQPIDLGEGLHEDDCFFFGPQFDERSAFVLLSCNNPFYSGKSGDDRFAMWERLWERIRDDPSVKLLIQGGDQVYNDDIEIACLDALKGAKPGKPFVVQQIIKNYQHYYGHPTYRKIMASVPSVAMLDDHDITDGWGGRSELFTKKEFKPAWSDYLKYTYEAFEAYQTRKNPPELAAGIATTVLDFGVNRLYMLDLRREKNIKNQNEPLMSSDHLQKLIESVAATPNTIAKLFILSPVVPTRTNPALEEAMTVVSQGLYFLRSLAATRRLPNADRMRPFWIGLYWLTGLWDVATLADDITDGLSSTVNRPTLFKLLDALLRLTREKDIAPFVLSGDIHTGGLSEIVVRKGENTVISLKS